MMMKNAIHPLHVLVVIVFMLCMNTSSQSSASKHINVIKYCIQRERQALLLFRQGVANENDLLDSWNEEVEEDCCKWKGVGCDNRTGHVTHLLLSSLISPRPLYPFTNTSRVTIGHSLLDLPYLTYLDLSSNQITRIPRFIGSFKRLVHLDLSNTWPAGSVPSQIGNLSNLQYLDLSFNYFYGFTIPKFIGSLNSLRYIDLSYSWFTGVIPHELGNLSKLQHLDLGYNYYLTGGGNFNWLFNLSSLTYIDLSWIEIAPPSIWASFIQRIPSISFMRLEDCNLSAPTFSNFSSSISTLHLAGNRINSSIFDWISHLSGSLVELDLGFNMLEGKIPQSLGHMTALTHLNLWHNLLNGSIPQSFGHMTALTYLDLGGNLLDGSIPQSLGHMTALTHLNLEYNLLTGPIPNTFALMTALSHLDLSENQLHGVIAKSFGNSSSLQFADFSSNNFTGNLEDFVNGPFPLLEILLISENQLTGSLPDITLLPSLRCLEVNSNQLNGYLPTVFKNYSALQVLDLSNNHLRGSLPDFTGFSSLESLYLDGNEFSGSVPDFTGLSSLVYLNLSNNEFSGRIPDFTGCSSLEELELGENQLTQWETLSIGLLYNLRHLDLSKNSFHGTISEAHLSNLYSLGHLDTSFNSLTFKFSSEWLPPFQLWKLSVASCKLGPEFPNWIRNQKRIEYLDISNSQISDNIPIWFGNLSSVMKLLNLSSNRIRGKFSFNFVQIEVIDLSSNYFSGPLPPIPRTCSKINLSRNKFSGTLLSFSVVEHFALSFLDISHNKLFGALPDNWVHYGFLAFLNLGYNNFSGRIPTSIGQLDLLQTLILRNNKLYGELPASLGNCGDLGFVDFGFNKLSGKIPSWIGKKLPKLYGLILKSNRFYGILPYGICHLRNLHFLDVSINRISGTIPPCFGNFTAMTQKGNEVGKHAYKTNSSNSSTVSDYYVDNVLARWKGQEFEYGSNFAYLKMIDLSTNEFTGEIPIEITRLLELKGLNLSRNRFNGKLPPEIGQLKVLECLDLSTNKFSGEIPRSMSGLTFLAFLDLSNNNFSGKIPSGTQLQGFNISAYEGNTELCGKPLTNICSGDEPTDHIRPSYGDYEVDGDDSEYERWLYISAVLGFSITFWGIIGTLVLNRRWRHAYFQFLYNLKERFFVGMAVRIARLQMNN